METLLAVKRALLKSESLTHKPAVHKKLQDVDKAVRQFCGNEVSMSHEWQSILRFILGGYGFLVVE